MSLNIQKIAAFSDGDAGGNPAGVVIEDVLPAEKDMQAIAADVGFSETAFATPFGDAGQNNEWRVRYFSPESEVPFCGHATIALGAALTMKYGAGEFSLALNNANITVAGEMGGGVITAANAEDPKGAVFTITLPLDSGPSAGPAGEPFKNQTVETKRG